MTFPSPDNENTDTPTLPDHRLRAGRCPHLVNVSGFLLRCTRDRHDGPIHFWGGVFRDAAQVPALQATARRWEQAQKLAGWLKGGLPAPESTRWRRSYDALLDLLTEATDGE